MGVLGSDGLSLTVGDGATPEVFQLLRGTQVTTFEMTQELADTSAIATDAWQAGVTVTARRIRLAFDGLMTDETAARRVRQVALTGVAANFRLALGGSETLAFGAYVTQYREVIQAGSLKRFTCEVESSGAAVII